MTKTRQAVEFGDFQTPPALATAACRCLERHGIRARSILEPTCGIGAFLTAALARFPAAETAIGLDVNPKHVESARTALCRTKARVEHQDFFDTQWPALVADLPEPILIIGNPPWVTNAELGAIGGGNLPVKENRERLPGLDALTGKSNFDISEWMLQRLLEATDGRDATLAMLVKTAVARKVLVHAWKRGAVITADIHRIDAMQHFGASVDACLLICRPGSDARDCRVHESLEDDGTTTTFGYRDDTLVADVELRERWRHLRGADAEWRSGIKHDCAKVMELRDRGDHLENGFGEPVDVEDDCLFPMLKSSEVANGGAPTRWMLVTQRTIGEDTNALPPKTRRYLERHGERLDRRASSIYRNRPRFSVFGVGDYAFAPWKVAISGLYKKLAFRVVAPHRGKPVVLDDTCYFLSFDDEAEAERVAALLNATPAQEFYRALVFWDAKRPVTAEILRQLGLAGLAVEAGVTNPTGGRPGRRD